MVYNILCITDEGVTTFFVKAVFSHPVLVLITISIALVVNQNAFQHSRFFASAGAIKGSWFKKLNNARRYFMLNEINRQLVLENASLRKAARPSFNRLGARPADTINQHVYEYIPAHVVNNSVNKQFNYITIDAGTLKGIENESGVLSPEGVAGIIKNTTSNYALAMSILNTHAKISAKLKNSEHFGSTGVVWKRLSLRSPARHTAPCKV
ncbi:MAG: hypothetical protein HC896_01000 [Bacteroidales bacterium]|nr:hypothetical protein [Bacteroidales bacterium]